MYNYYPWYPAQQTGAWYPYSPEMGMNRQTNNGNGMMNGGMMNGGGMNGGTMNGGVLPMEQSYIENILRLNSGKPAAVYMTFEGNPDWQSMVFRGIIEEAGRDHIVLRDPDTGRWYLLLMVYLDYVVFDEEINYQYPYDGQSPTSNR
ncbi:spore coat protein GerQ [Salibacterium qingdaonense]|uniref:Spore germination protein Q n=1 Tax=Salibacterium qingdaonense TaxID=266892 RepID=A0A1I4QC10_9BACI|nr:spore coat protein GerQ [Salibacterium qingdaonense]SFM37163.1 spore germination protein Q [Salibacterium qingdaonense]